MKTVMKKLSPWLALAALALHAAPAFASVAANTQIVNQASLSYNDGAAIRTATAAVTVTVSLVPGIPNIAIGPPQTTSYNGPNTVLHNTFTVTNSGNGPDTFNLGTVVSGAANTTAPTSVVANPAVPGTLALGGTITVAGSTKSAILVPSDGVADSAVNGITAGSTVVIGGEVRTVNAVSDPGLSGTATITLSSALTNPAPGAGVIVGEQKTVTVDVTAGSIGTPGVNITVNKNLTVTSTHAPGATLTSASITDTFTSGVASLTKYVRNVTTGQTGTTKLTHNAADYYQSGITAKTGDVLEYILVASNSGSAAVTASVVTDVLPTSFVTLKTAVYNANTKDLIYEDASGTLTFLSAANDGDTANYNAGTSTITVNVGTGATANNGTNLGGAIDAGKSVFVYYQTVIN